MKTSEIPIIIFTLIAIVILFFFMISRNIAVVAEATPSDIPSSVDILAEEIDTNQVKLIPLPRPNSGTYSFEEAEQRKHEIYDMELTPKYFDWKNPSTGGAIHINQKDEIEIYQFTFSLSNKDTFIVVQAEDIQQHVQGLGMGNPATVLITSEYDLRKSKSLPLVLEEVFEPATQIYYLKSK